MCVLWVFELVLVCSTTYPSHWNQVCQVYTIVVSHGPTRPFWANLLSMAGQQCLRVICGSLDS